MLMEKNVSKNRLGVFVSAWNRRYYTIVCYSIENCNAFLELNKDYGILDADKTRNIYHCAKTNDMGEIHDIKNEQGIIIK